MQSKPFSDIVDACLDQLRVGVSIDDCVAPYPEHADELRPQLQVAQSLFASRPQIQPEPSAQAQGRARLLGALAQMREEPEPTLGLVGPLRALVLGISSRLTLLPQALPAVLAMFVLGGAAWGVSAAAGNPNPGNWFVGSSSQEARVELRGTITAIEPPMLTISTDTGEVSVQIDDGTEFEGDTKMSLALADFNVGDFVKISAFRDETGVLIAREIELEEEEADENEDGVGDPDGDDDADNSGPGSPNSGPGNADDDEDDEDNSGPGNADDDDDRDHDNSGPGNADDDDDGDQDNSGPGNSNQDNDDDDDDDEHDNSGPGSSDDDDEDDDEHDEEDDDEDDD